MSEREAHQKKLRAQLDEWGAEIDRLKAKADAAEAGGQLEYNKQIGELRTRLEAANQKLSELKSASDDAWEDLKAGLESAWDSMSNAVKSARDRFSQDPCLCGPSVTSLRRTQVEHKETFISVRNRPFVNPDPANPDEQSLDQAVVDWACEQGERTAAEEGVDMTEERWALVDCPPDHYRRHGATSSGRNVAQVADDAFLEQGGNSYLHKLFPGGPTRCRKAAASVVRSFHRTALMNHLVVLCSLGDVNHRLSVSPTRRI